MIETGRDAAARKLTSFLVVLGYER
jgi:hypothetical protein